MKNFKTSKTWLLVVVLLSLTCISISAQEFINTRKISLSRGDTTIVAGILADVKIDEVRSRVFYYWYANGQINTNQSGYAGNLLHGEYVEYAPDGKLLLKGHFAHGTRSGQWIYWFKEGAIRKIASYNKGVLEGKSAEYAPDGTTIYSANYKNNLLHGKMETVANDTLFQLAYRKGIEKKRTVLHVFE